MDKRKMEQIRQKYDLVIHINEEADVEFWYARELMSLLGYDRWENFDKAVGRAIESCKTSGKQELIEERISLIERTQARGRLKEAEKRLSQNIYERGVDDAGFGRIRSKGDRALFGGYSTQEMKSKLGVKENRPLADFLPTLTIAAKNLATEMTNYNVEEKDLQGEKAITDEHVQNNSTIRDMLGQRGIKPENLPPSEDIKKLERRVKSQEKKLASKAGKLPSLDEKL